MARTSQPYRYTERQLARLRNYQRACRYDLDESVVRRRPEWPLVIGEAPNRSGAGSDPRDIFATGRLAEYGDVARFERVNVLKSWPGEAGGGSAFPMTQARPAARELRSCQPIGRPFILVGTRVASAFGCRRRDYEYLEWIEHLDRKLVVVPHPSGLNRWWNVPENVAAIERFFYTLPGAELRGVA